MQLRFQCRGWEQSSGEAGSRENGREAEDEEGKAEAQQQAWKRGTEVTTASRPRGHRGAARALLRFQGGRGAGKAEARAQEAKERRSKDEGENMNGVATEPPGPSQGRADSTP